MRLLQIFGYLVIVYTEEDVKQNVCRHNSCVLNSCNHEKRAMWIYSSSCDTHHVSEKSNPIRIEN